MTKEIVVNVGERETRIAVLEESKLVELHIERAERVVGSLYKCRVANVLPGMDAAFVDIGLERNAFLYVGDVLPTGDDASGTESGNGAYRAESSPNGDGDTRRRSRYARERRRGGEAATPSSLPTAESEEATEGTVNGDEAEIAALEEAAELALDAGLGAEEAETLEAVDEADEEETELAGEGAETPPGETGERTSARPRRNLRRSALRQQRIKDVLHVGQELLVQVIKGPRSTKGARVSTRISLPGRYLVLMPEADNLGVSRKIEDPKERDRLKKIGEKLREPGFGLIIRTEAEEKTEQELRQDRDFLLQTWRQIQETAKKVRAPALVQQDLTLLYKTIRDVFGSDVSKLVIDDPAEYEKANELLERLSPKLKGRIHLYDGVQPIFDSYGLEAEIDRLLKRKVFLKSGGSLVIDETEALTVIDVNTSKFVGSSSLAETIVKTNLDAANEIARQLRLRDIGGIIVIDFIDMSNARDKQAVVKALETALKRDRSRTKISNISPLGLVEMTRKRTGETLVSFMTDECPYCKGRGHLPSAESVSFLVERDLRRQVNSQQNAKKDAFLITCHPEVAELLIGLGGTTITTIERQLQRALYVRADEEAHIEKYSIEAGDIAEFEKSWVNYRRAQVVECRIARSLLKETAKCIGWANGFMLDLDDGHKLIGQKAKARILDVRRSFAVGQIVPGTIRPLDS
ncbi:MAG TPA: Rne/Rng family ribonuclease [Chthonomonadaceae bacterium]|nr:Rne/Rng family ribonuclease [Chthonomonadaceae bacterium]